MTGNLFRMTLDELVSRSRHPEPWFEGDNLPWSDPEFSERMLREHLSQNHDAASRRGVRIKRQTAWIHERLLEGHAAKVLDLGCGPGLYANRLVGLGHECHGIDFGPASIAYATESARGLRCSYQCEDLRSAEYGQGHHLVMLIFGEFNTFNPADARTVLRKCRSAIRPDGLLLLEPHTFEFIRGMAQKPASWRTSEGGLFLDRHHLCLEERFWNDSARTTTTRYYVIDAATANVTRYACSYQAYTEVDYRAVLAECGFTDVTFYPSLTGEADHPEEGLFALTARRAKCG
jgi:SAM-dependent methyltransferase